MLLRCRRNVNSGLHGLRYRKFGFITNCIRLKLWKLSWTFTEDFLYLTWGSLSLTRLPELTGVLRWKFPSKRRKGTGPPPCHCPRGRRSVGASLLDNSLVSLSQCPLLPDSCENSLTSEKTHQLPGHLAVCVWVPAVYRSLGMPAAQNLKTGGAYGTTAS